MAVPEANLDEYDKEARDVLGAAAGEGIGEGPVPDLEEENPAPPISAPVEGPEEPPESFLDRVAAPPEVADVAGTAPPVTPLTPAEAVPVNAALGARQGALDVEKAKINAATADRMAADAQAADEDARIERAEYLQRRQDAERDLADRVKAYEAGNKIVDPRSRTNGVKSTLAVIFGGLGAGLSAAGGGSSRNEGLAALTKKWDDDTEIQKANIAALRDNAIMARTRLEDVDAGRRTMLRDADARLLAKYNLALKQGEAQLKAQGANQAQIDADGRIVKLRAGLAAAKLQAQKDEDAHLLNQARIARLNAQAARDQRKAKGGGGGGGGSTGGADVAEYLIQNPGDIPGAKRLAAQKGVGSKEFDKIVNQTKPTESQAKDAKQAAVGMRAVDAIEKSGYTPSRDDIQKWLNNQRQVYQAAKAGEGGGIGGLLGGLAAGSAQKHGLMAQSEVEGLPEDAQAYFANVRRFMETIGRAQSGAAISPTEWQNFFNQYGPNSAGGLAAAKQYLQDQARASGVAGRSLNAQPAGGPPPAAGPSSDAIKQAKALINLPPSDPRRTPEREARARKILSDAMKPIKL